MERVTGIGGIFFKARDPRQMMAWYSKHLGIPAGSEEETHAMFEWREASEPQRPVRRSGRCFPRTPSTSAPARRP